MKLVRQKQFLQDGRTTNKLVTPQESPGVLTLLQTLIKTDVKAPGWYSASRDQYLRDEVIRNPFLDSFVSTVTMKIENLPIKVLSRDSGVEKYNRLADAYNDILGNALYKDQTLEKFIRSMLTQDNGAFMYIKGAESSDRPLASSPTGLLYLDSTRCTRTGDPDYPVVFLDYDGKYYKIHDSRIIMCAQSPSTDAEMFGVGYSFVSRTMMLAQHFYDIYAYEGEVLGSRSSEEIIYGTGVRSDDIRKAFELADIDSDNAGLMRYGKRVYIGMREAAGKLGKLQLKSLPDNFQKRDDIEITLTLIALASGGSPNWFYDSVRSGSTKASAAESTKMGESKLELWYINMICAELDYKFLPPSLQSIAGNYDEDNNGIRARIKLNLAQTRNQNILSGVTDVRTERELQLERGEITKSQFETIELKEGRTANGLPIYTYYQTDEKTLQDLIFFTPDPMNFTDNVSDPDILDKIDNYWEIAQGIALNGRSISIQNYGLRAMYLLEWTRKQYEKLLGVTPRYDFNDGKDTVVNGEIVSMRNIGQNIPNDNNPLIPPDPNAVPPNPQDLNANHQDPNANPQTSNTNPVTPGNTGGVKNGLNDQATIDNNTNNKDANIEKMFSTRHSRLYRKELRSLVRDRWNEIITEKDFVDNFSEVLKDALGNSPANGVQSYIDDLNNLINTNLRKDNGKLYNIYEQTDRWVLWA